MAATTKTKTNLQVQTERGYGKGCWIFSLVNSDVPEFECFTVNTDTTKESKNLDHAFLSTTNLERYFNPILWKLQEIHRCQMYAVYSVYPMYSPISVPLRDIPLSSILYHQPNQTSKTEYCCSKWQRSWQSYKNCTPMATKITAACLSQLKPAAFWLPLTRWRLWENEGRIRWHFHSCIHQTSYCNCKRRCWWLTRIGNWNSVKHFRPVTMENKTPTKLCWTMDPTPKSSREE